MHLDPTVQLEDLEHEGGLRGCAISENPELHKDMAPLTYLKRNSQEIENLNADYV